MRNYIQSKPIIQAKQSLLLIVPVVSFGVIMTTFIAPGIVGKTIFTLTKIWLVLLPLFWRLKIERKSIKLPKITIKQINFGLILGLIMFAAIAIAYWFLGLKFLDIAQVRSQATNIGINSVSIYFAGVLYWSFINAFIEECVWRGFVHRQCNIIQPGRTAVIFSAIFFTLHHVIALFFYLNNILLVTIASLGVFIAGAIWSACYQKSGFWACYISHILADLAIGLVGWHLLFYN